MTLFKRVPSRTLLYSMLSLTLCLSGCSAIHDSLKGAQGDQGPKLTGNWVGFIGLIDASGKRVDDKSGVTVTVTNPSELSAAALTSPIVATTNSDGKFVIKNLQTGTYTLTFSKPGYGEMKVYNQGFVGDGDQMLGPVAGSFTRYYLSAIPEYRITSADVSLYYSSDLRFRFKPIMTSSIPTSAVYGQLFIGTTPDVSKNNYKKVLQPSRVYVDYDGSCYFYIYPPYDLQGLPESETLYCVAYPVAWPGYSVDSGLLPSAYFDPVLGRNVYTSLGEPSEVVSFKKP